MNNQEFASQLATAKKEASSANTQRRELSRLFIVCGRNRSADELHSLFSSCGTIKHFHLALDRSKKSRGFAFLQYEDPADATAAIDRLDHFKLPDGHILKVTVAKERMVERHGKLKRDQHTRHDFDEKAEVTDKEVNDCIDSRLPGKRQRSSPPIAVAQLELSQAAPRFMLEDCRLGDPKANNIENMARSNVKEMVASQLSSYSGQVYTKKSIEADEDLSNVKQVVHSLVLAVDQVEVHNKASNELFAVYKHVLATSNGSSTQMHSEDLVPSLQGEFEEESSTESLTSSIQSVSLASNSTIIEDSTYNTHTTLTRKRGVLPAPRSECHHRGRRQSLNDRGSTAEDNFDGSYSRRKRTNTTGSSSCTTKDELRANAIGLPSSRKSPLSDLSNLSYSSQSQDDLQGEILSKRLCKRQSSDNDIEEPYRSAKQQATLKRREHDGGITDRKPVQTSTVSGDQMYEIDREIKIEPDSEQTEPNRTKLFFTSTYKFTEQEVEAMFAVYGDFKSVELVKSFGRVKTMAYISYYKSATAAFVFKSFKDESYQGDEDPERPDFMTLSFAHNFERQQQRIKSTRCGLESAPGCASNVCSSLITADTAALSDVSSDRNDRLWVLLLYDRYLATHVLSSVASSYPGMEFIDIKLTSSTGEPQGVAFVKFDSEANATQAALQLHHMELPSKSGKVLQAVVIQVPSLFTTSHDSTLTGINESMRISRLAEKSAPIGSSADVDLHAMETQFAHLMRSTKHSHTTEGQFYQNYSPIHLPKRTASCDHSSPMAPNVYPPASPDGFYPLVGMGYYSTPLMSYQPPPSFYPYANYGGENPHVVQQHYYYGGNAASWINTASCIPGQNFSEQGSEYPIHFTDDINGTESASARSKPRSVRLSSRKMDVEDNNNNQTSCSIQISTSKPLELVTLAAALQNCSGIMSFAKVAGSESDSNSFNVEFTNETHTIAALRKLDKSLCGDQKLQVTRISSSRHRGGGGNWNKARAGGSGRRKRQRVDLRSRK
ncbi:FOG: RRM domain [Plasmopara halstedii]|uniref:FOG: RRM domain n=1 Tax=Plasmopara halstedii TaxID=4781 RepID=A0A0P1AT43_PLAHL|nr:FOG: RRM domain [Plasmopara halstedii]CEG45452.1 FOG: RRM domain [Plasmopara halstedii]|eukprot:XP_024581821.1 FOG: RRM domain [Plasmopara halstedii]